jgi:hypothetical protein
MAKTTTIASKRSRTKKAQQLEKGIFKVYDRDPAEVVSTPFIMRLRQVAEVWVWQDPNDARRRIEWWALLKAANGSWKYTEDHEPSSVHVDKTLRFIFTQNHPGGTESQARTSFNNRCNAINQDPNVRVEIKIEAVCVEF